MYWILGAIFSGITAFVATNIDDIVLLMLFFARVNRNFRSKHIVVGQYLGFLVLIIASLPGFLGGLAIPRAWVGLLGLMPIAIGIKDLLNKNSDDEVIQAVSRSIEIKPANGNQFLNSIINPQSYGVAAVTIANGGDNIGIYIPLFASGDLAHLLVILWVFLVMIGVWCYVAYRLAQHPSVAKILTNYGKVLTPYILIGLGIYIIVESGTYKLFTPWLLPK